MPRVKKTDDSETVKEPKATKAVKASSEQKTEDTVKKSTLKTEVINTKGEVVGAITLPREIFGAKVNATLMAQAVRVYLANQRQGSAQAKTRGQVQGSTKKMGRQKGSGRARHGSIRAPIYVGGGKAHGPQPKDWGLNFPKKMKRAALFSALSAKLQENQVVVFDGLDSIEAKTRVLVTALQGKDTPSASSGQEKKQQKSLLVLPGKKENIQRAARNVPFITVEDAANLNTYEVLHAQRVLFMKEAIVRLEEVFLKGRV